MAMTWKDAGKTHRRGAVVPLLMAGAGAAIWLALRPSKDTGAKAHRADGSDDSRSFAAGIADEGTIPDTPVSNLGF